MDATFKFVEPRARSLALLAGVLAHVPAAAALASELCPESAVRWASSSARLYVSGAASCTLSDLSALVSPAQLEQVDAQRRIWLLRANIFLQEGATLRLHGSAAGGDVNELRLRSDSAGFVIIRADHGNLDVASTTIRSWSESAGVVDTDLSDGRAYIGVRSRLDAQGVARESRMDIRDSDLGYLGYAGSEAYGLTWKVSGSGSGLYDKVDVLGDVTNSRIHHNYFGAYTYGAHGMRWIGNQIDHNHEYGLDPHDDSDHLLIENNDVHDNGNHGIICSKRCNDLVIRGNRSWNNSGNGIMIHRQVTDSLVADNQAFGNGDAGIAVFDSTGNVIRNNHLHDNRRGIRLSVASSDNLFEANRIEGNWQYGIYSYQGSDLPTAGGDGHNRNNVFTGNRVEGNGMAVKLGHADDNLFIGNRFAGNTGGLQFTDSRNNLLSGNDIPADSRIVSKTSTIKTVTIISDAGGPLRVETDGDAKIVLRETSARSYILEGVSAGARVTPEESLFTLSGSRIAEPRTVTPVWIYGRPSGGAIYLTATSATSWRTRAASGSASVDYTVSRLLPGTSYVVKRGTVVLGRLATDDGGVLTFSDTVGTSSLSYSVTRADQEVSMVEP